MPCYMLNAREPGEKILVWTASSKCLHGTWRSPALLPPGTLRCWVAVARWPFVYRRRRANLLIARDTAMSELAPLRLLARFAHEERGDLGRRHRSSNERPLETRSTMSRQQRFWI